MIGGSPPFITWRPLSVDTASCAASIPMYRMKPHRSPCLERFGRSAASRNSPNCAASIWMPSSSQSAGRPPTKSGMGSCGVDAPPPGAPALACSPSGGAPPGEAPPPPPPPMAPPGGVPAGRIRWLASSIAAAAPCCITGTCGGGMLGGPPGGGPTFAWACGGGGGTRIRFSGRFWNCIFCPPCSGVLAGAVCSFPSHPTHTSAICDGSFSSGPSSETINWPSGPT